jgi:hypothetical protein
MKQFLETGNALFFFSFALLIYSAWLHLTE